MRHQLNNRLQQLSAVTVLPGPTQRTQLVIRRGKHLQPLQRRHRQRQVLLRIIQLLDIRRHLRDCQLRLHCAVAHVVNLLEELR